MGKGGKIYLLILGLCLLFCAQSNAQTEERPFWISVNVGHNEYDGDFGNQFFNFGIGDDWTFGATADLYLNPSFDATYAFDVGVLDAEMTFPNRVEFFNNTFLKNALLLRYKFSNGYIFPKNSSVQPYITGGVGITFYTGGERDVLNRGVTPDVRSGQVITLPAGVGFNIPVGEKVHLYAQSVYHRTFAEGYDGRDKLDNRDHDDYLIHSVGVKIALSGSRDRDDDGIPDKEDACPAEKGPEELDGCPDQDGDGIADRYDRCPRVAGVDYANGCPDTDGDRVQDSMDKCPETAGDPKLDGCPDDDGDGIINKIDECPEQPGLKELNGCPDEDGDGIPDQEDACPETAGSKELNGCPDSDGDGIADTNDKCPEQAGPADRDGCPVKVSDEIQKELNQIAENITFPAGKSSVSSSSEEYLNRLAEILQSDENLNLIIEAYTDSEGNAAYNLKLSKDRAKAVAAYLVEHGISSDRVRAEGYGEILPVATNETAEGRAKNRRIELRLTYF